jgi:Tol biopolymer transport system component
MRRLAAPLALAAALVAAAPAHATLPGGNGRIAYAATGVTVEDDGTRAPYRAIATVKSDGRGDHFVRECRLVRPAAQGDCSIQYRSPAWAPGGRRLAFDAGRSLAVVGSDDSGFRVLRAVTADDGDPAFSPSGRQLVLTGRSGGATGLYVLDISSGRARRIARRASAPDWSRRNRIAFVRAGNVYSVRPDGRGLRRITRGGGAAPSWSPTGRTLVVARGGGIFAVGADGRGLRRAVRCRCKAPAYSPDGRFIVYERSGIEVAGARDGRRVARLVENVRGGGERFEGTHPTWQPRR